MPDDTKNNKLELSRRKILAGAGAIGLASAGAGLGASAFFSDQETFTNNSLTVGSLDLKVDWEEHYSDWSADESEGLENDVLMESPQNGRDYVGLPDPVNPLIWVHQDDLSTFMDNTSIEAYPDTDDDGIQDFPEGWDDPESDNYVCNIGADTPEDLDPRDGLRTENVAEKSARGEATVDQDGNPLPLVNIADVKPGDFGKLTLSFHLCNNPGWVWLRADNVSESENGLVDPESAVDDSPDDAELAEDIQTAWWIDDGNNVIDEEIGVVDVMIAVDTSGTLDQSDVEQLEDDANSLASSLDATGNARVGGLSFATDVEDFVGLSGSPVSFSGLAAGGATAMPPALDVAAEELDVNGRPEAQTFIVLFTDGGPNYRNNGYDTFPIGGGFTPGPYTEGDQTDGTVDDGELCEMSNVAADVREDHRVLAVGIDDDGPITGNADAVDCDGNDIDSLGEYLRDYIAGGMDDYFQAEDAEAVSDLKSDVLEAVAMREKVFRRGTLLDDLTGPLSGEGILLDGDMTSEGTDCFEPSATHYIGFAWWLPEDVGNEVQSESVSFDLGFYTEQCRHNDASGLAVGNQVTYAVTIEPVTENEDTVRQILIQFTGSGQETLDLIESGGVVIETDDEAEAKVLAEDLREADAQVEIERREP